MNAPSATGPNCDASSTVYNDLIADDAIINGNATCIVSGVTVINGDATISNDLVVGATIVNGDTTRLVAGATV